MRHPNLLFPRIVYNTYITLKDRNADRLLLSKRTALSAHIALDDARWNCDHNIVSKKGLVAVFVYQLSTWACLLAAKILEDTGFHLIE